MSVLAHALDDHPEAARKLATDARALLASHRHDGAAYLAGYVVECVAKAVVLHDQAYDPATGKTDALKVEGWHKILRGRQYGHKIPDPLAIVLTPVGARYFSYLPASTEKIVRNWSETLRYRAANTVPPADAQEYVDSASHAEEAIVQMTLDGVL